MNTEFHNINGYCIVVNTNETTASQYWKYGTNPTRAVQYSESRANSMNSKTVKNILNGSIGSTKPTPSSPPSPARKGGAPSNERNLQ